MLRWSGLIHCVIKMDIFAIQKNRLDLLSKSCWNERESSALVQRTWFPILLSRKCSQWITSQIWDKRRSSKWQDFDNRMQRVNKARPQHNSFFTLTLEVCFLSYHEIFNTNRLTCVGILGIKEAKQYFLGTAVLKCLSLKEEKTTASFQKKLNPCQQRCKPALWVFYLCCHPVTKIRKCRPKALKADRGQSVKPSWMHPHSESPASANIIHAPDLEWGLQKEIDCTQIFACALLKK